MEIRDIPLDQIRPNPWNPNAMDERAFQRLVDNIRRRGFRQPLLVRPVFVEVVEGGRRVRKGVLSHYEIVDGEHRFRALKELGAEAAPCYVLEPETSDTDAKIDTITMNRLRGQFVPAKLAELIHDLHRTYTLDELERLTGIDEPELKDALELLKLPAGLAEEVERQAEEEAREQPVILTFALFPKQAEVVERALAHIIETEGFTKNARGMALEMMAADYLAGAAYAPREADESDSG